MSWEQIWGPTDFIVIDGERGAVYGRPAPGTKLPDDLYRWTGEPGVWIPLQIPAKPVLACVTAGCKPNNTLFYLAGNGVVYRYLGAPKAWKPIGGPSQGKAGMLYGGPDQLLATAPGPTPNVFRWDEASQTWVLIGGPGKAFAVGSSGSTEFKVHVFGLSPDAAPAATKGIYQWLGGTTWQKVSGPMASLYASGQAVFATDPASGNILQRTATGWIAVGGPGRFFAADQNGHLYGTSPDASPPAAKGVYAWQGKPGAWAKIGGPADKLFAGWDRQVFATNPANGDLWHYVPLEVPIVAKAPDFAKQHVSDIVPVSGKRKLLTVLWDPKRPAHPAPDKAEITNALFGPRPSVRDWLLENSGGKVELVNTGVRGWYTAPANKQGDHYWDNPYDTANDPAQQDPHYHHNKYKDGWLDGHAEKWADALTAATEMFSVASHDANKDKWLTPEELGILIVLPQNEPYGAVRTVVGTQCPFDKPLFIQGVRFTDIAEWYAGKPIDFGTAAHELAHLLLHTPDMYFDGYWPYAASVYSNSDNSDILQHLSGPEKLKFGWLKYRVVPKSGEYDLQDVETHQDALILFNPKHGSSEYFLLENRWRGTSYDAGGPKIGAGIPMDGLAVWHVIDDPTIFNEVKPFPPTGVLGEWGRLGVRLIRANGSVPVDDAAALFAQKDMLISDLTWPANLQWLDGSPSGLSIKLLTNAAPVMKVQISLSGV